MLKKLSLISQSSYRRILYPLISVIVAVSLCTGTILPSQAIPWRELIFRSIQMISISNLSKTQEVELGKQINQQLLESGNIKLYRDRAAKKYIDRIGQRLVLASPRSDIPYTFQVVEDDSINAFATMGGFVYINTGLMKAADNEAELASVIAHEIAHIADRHALKQLRQTLLAQGLATAAGVDNSVAVQIAVELALRRPKSRQAEFEADQIGIETLGKAGYAQYAAITFMQKLLKKSSPPSFLSTHPATSTRISQMKQMINPEFAYNGDGLDDRRYQVILNRLLP
ncbi:MAG: M48 family metallopeptidase [Trichodesmium sp. St16_bin4-tuft]|nr:M48 family metallopeptidase [Trichodesmium sp. ALOHA_ZT_67]MDE5077938.1 M48 family metallopeptidase [Trichodesmium sp. St2_bin6]MDE5098360.1 M48 family metallopeptidase [Trichodesmium sp. St16_bin4-tuft]MDE5105088.1 M48 family metallopeptidase [Trichodesmium sp. St19_bin2]MDT9340752.1 M48 family metallopeptidase [Trichodesmium erythraeum 21-75]